MHGLGFLNSLTHHSPLSDHLIATLRKKGQVTGSDQDLDNVFVSRTDTPSWPKHFTHSATDILFSYHPSLKKFVLFMNLSKLQEAVEGRGAWHVVVHGVTESQTWLRTTTEATQMVWIWKSPHRGKFSCRVRHSVHLARERNKFYYVWPLRFCGWFCLLQCSTVLDNAFDYNSLSEYYNFLK